MRIKIHGCGFYGAHLGAALIQRGHNVTIFDTADRIFSGASGNIPARLHAGALHYPRSHATRKACMDHREAFMAAYGFLTRGIEVNLYAIAEHESLIDFGTYREVVGRDLEFITVHDPAEFGLQHVEGAILTGERHIVVDRARAHFEKILDGHLVFGAPPGVEDGPDWDLTIDATFAANSAAGIDRYEPCLVLLLRGPVGKSVTVLDGPFPSLYVWDEDQSLCSLSSAKWSPFSKQCRTYNEARVLLDGLEGDQIVYQGERMIESMRLFYPAIDAFEVADYRLSIRAMPLSGADTRLVDVVQDGKLIRVRAGKIDAIFHAEHEIMRMIGA